MKTLLSMAAFLILHMAHSQTAKFTYQYHNDIARGGKFIFKDVSGKLLFEGDAGAGNLTAFNNPYYQSIINKGPIPNGTWEIYAIKDKEKAILKLRPTSDVLLFKVSVDENDKRVKELRSGFLIHGYGEGSGPSESSKGCIILEKKFRLILLKFFEENGVIPITVSNIVTGNVVN